MKIVRFAPSPTGHLHIGGVRTALFCYFFVKNQGGEYILRIEDTDVSRSDAEMANEIIKGLQWLGIEWDKGPFYQSKRFELYKKTAMQLLEDKKVYRCFCTPEELEKRRETQKEEKIYKYDRKCYHLSDEEINQKLEQKIPHVLRFYIPEGNTYFKDSIHKEMKIENTQLDDFVLLKSDHSPTYHLSVVVDDHDMGMTNVIRGDDHISNTFKQVLLFKALGLKPPKYAHLPLILGPDKKKLSKRHGETSVLEFKKTGYLPEAIITYLSQLSWIPGDSKKIFRVDELVKQFSLSKLSKNSPVFDYDKLRHLNSIAIKQKKAPDLHRLLMEDPEFAAKYGTYDEQKQHALIDLVKPRMKTLKEFDAKFAIYLAGNLDYTKEEQAKLENNYTIDEIKRNLELLVPALEQVDEFTGQKVEETLRECAENNKLKAADFIHPARYALTSETVSPSLFDVFEFFGKKESIARINGLLENPGKGK
ncbi:MAG: glutamate--tRNA ligase [bacterium]|nr:glutamate--tRNA ligase [bacterium]